MITVRDQIANRLQDDKFPLNVHWPAAHAAGRESVAMRKWKLRWVLVVLTMLVAVGGFALWPQPMRINQQSFGRIQRGMNFAEVQAIVGQPGDYTTGPTITTYLSSSVDLGQQSHKWKTDEGEFYLVLDGADLVTDKAFFPSEPEKQSPLDNLTWRARRKWRKWFPVKYEE